MSNVTFKISNLFIGNDCHFLQVAKISAKACLFLFQTEKFESGDVLLCLQKVTVLSVALNG